MTRWRAGAAATLVFALLTACTPQGESPAAPSPIELEHLHGIAMAPGGDVIFVATHSGLFQVPLDGKSSPRPMPVAPFDAMGFAVITETATLIASGHPPTGGNLGLMSSVNGGSTWEILPTTEDTDFHAVAAVNQELYAVDSETRRLWASKDSGKTWTHGARLETLDIAITDEGELYATTAAGLQLSADNGLNFSVLDEAPGLLFIERDNRAVGAVVGIDAEGTVWRSGGGGTAWEQFGRIAGNPQALAISANGAVIVATERGIFQSADGMRWDDVWIRG